MNLNEVSHGCRTCPDKVCEIADIAFVYKEFAKEMGIENYFNDRPEDLLLNNVHNVSTCAACMKTPESLNEIGSDRKKVEKIGNQLDHLLGEITEFNTIEKVRSTLPKMYRLIGENVETILGDNWKDRSSFAKEQMNYNKMWSPLGDKELDGSDGFTKPMEDIFKEFKYTVIAFGEDHGLKNEVRHIIRNIPTQCATVKEMVETIEYGMLMLSMNMFNDDISYERKMNYYLPLADMFLKLLWMIAPFGSEERTLANTVKEMINEKLLPAHNNATDEERDEEIRCISILLLAFHTMFMKMDFLHEIDVNCAGDDGTIVNTLLRAYIVTVCDDQNTFSKQHMTPRDIKNNLRELKEILELMSISGRDTDEKKGRMYRWTHFVVHQVYDAILGIVDCARVKKELGSDISDLTVAVHSHMKIYDVLFKYRENGDDVYDISHLTENEMEILDVVQRDVMSTYIDFIGTLEEVASDL